MADSSNQFKRSLNLLDITLLGIGSIIGSGWLFGAMKGAQYAGSLAWVAWLFGAVAIILIGLVYAELASAMPRAGGFIRYPQYTHGSMAGWFIAFSALLAYSSTAGVETDALREYASGWWPALGTAHDPSFLGILVQIALLVVFFLINYWSVNFFGKVNTVVTIFKFIVPGLIIVLLLTHMHVSNFSAGGADPGGIHGIMAAVTGAGIIFAYTGFRQAVDFGAESKNPQRNIPLGIILSIGISAIIYLALQFAFIGAIPSQLLNGGWSHISFDQPYANIAKLLGIFWLSNLVFVDAVVSPSGTGNIYMSGTARILFAWAKKGIFYTLFAKVDRRTGIPRGALWLSLILSIVWLLPPKNQLWSVLVSASGSASVMTYMVAPVSVASLRKTLPDMKRPFHLKASAHIIAPLSFVAASWIIYWSGWGTVSLLVGLILGSLILYFAFMDKGKKWHERLKTDSKAGIWLIVYYIFILVMSRLGSFGPDGSTAVIPSPWDSVVVAVLSLFFYYWGVYSALNKPQIDTDEEDDEMEQIEA
ncbi:MAG TPA: APC family permease [Bacillales bacterium]|nr:APC family permease [Bacillales bacterium]